MGGVDGGAIIRAAIISVVVTIYAGLDIYTYFWRTICFAAVPVCDWFTQI